MAYKSTPRGGLIIVLFCNKEKKGKIYNVSVEAILVSTSFNGRGDALVNTQPRMASRSLASMSRDEFMELVWENGQILMRGRSGTTKKGDACTGNSLYPTSNARAESGGNMRSKGARLESVYSTLNGTAFSDPLGRRDSALNPLSELYQLNLEDNTSKRLHPAGSHIFLEPDNFRPRNGSKFVGGIPQLTTSTSNLLEPSSLQFQASAALTRPSQSSIKTPLSMGGCHRSTLPEHESNPDKRTATVNSSYLRSAAHLKPNSQNSSVTQPMSSPVLTRVQELKDRGRNPLESTVIAPACGSKGATGLQNQPGAKLIPPVVAKTKESHNDEVCQTIGKHTSRRQLPGQSSSLVANTPSGKPDIIKLPEPTVSSSSVRSLGASNDPAYSLRRTYEDTEESGYPRQGIRRNVEEPQSIPKQAAPARNATGGKRSRIAEVHSLSERRRRDKINKRMRILKDLIPNSKKVDKASMLDEAIEYLKTLQLQLQIMSMRNGVCMPPMMLPTVMQHINAPHLTHFSPMGAGMGMRMGTAMGCSPPQFPTSQVGATALPGITGTGFHMLGFPGQTFPLSISHSNFIPSLGRPSAQSFVAPGISGPSPMGEHLGVDPRTGSMDYTQNISSEIMKHTTTESSKVQTSACAFNMSENHLLRENTKTVKNQE